MIFTYALFVVGFVILIKGADLLVEGASSIGKTLKLSSMIIGLTIVSFGTSLPELLVNIISSFTGNSEIGVGNVLGSNIANTLLILGVAAAISPLVINKNTYYIELPFSLTATLLVGFLANTELVRQGEGHTISFYDGLILLFFFSLFLGYIYTASKNQIQDEKDDTIHELPVSKALLYIFIGIVGLYFGGDWVVKGAVTIATDFGMSKSFVGLTIIAIGTSLPELVTSAVAAFRKNTDIAVGNVVGSNIFNLLWILGLSATLKPISYAEISNYDIYALIGSSTVLIFAIIFGKGTTIERHEGMIFILIYFAYIVYLLMREGHIFA